MRTSHGTRHGLALICLLLAVLVAAWSWHARPRSLPAPTAVPAVAGSAGTALADPPLDPVFGQRASSPLLRRVVEMYQPLAAGGTATLAWVDHPLAGASAPRFPVTGAEFFAGVTQLDGRWLSHAAIRALGGLHRLPPQAATLPQNMQASFSVAGEYLVSSADPAHPQAGDLRISWLAPAWPPSASAPKPLAPPAVAVSASWRPVAGCLLAGVLLLLALLLALGRRRR